jgi:hypothetical protein
MSKISLEGNVSGSGTLTIAAPNTNSNFTLTLPTETGTIITNSGNQAGSFTTLNTSGAVVFNDAGADVDFRVEGDTNANLLFVDAGNDRVGIGTSSPGALVEASKSVSGFNGIRVNNPSGANGAGVEMGVEFYNATNFQGKISAFRDTNEFRIMNLLSGAITFGTANTERMRIDSSGNLLVGTTAGVFGSERVAVNAGSARVFVGKTTSDGSEIYSAWSSATSGDNRFAGFWTETAATERGSITYNRTAGLVAYNTTSDYRAKDIIGPVVNSGELIDSVPVYMGKMKGATQERPMFIAHETPSYAHTGVKDAVDADGNPVYQQMDASALIPVMWAEIQSLRQRLAAANL